MKINLEKQLNTLEGQESEPSEIIRTKKKLEKMHEDEGNGAKIRSRVKWFEEGEKPTQYFHNLEKRNAKNKAWESIMDSSGNVFHGTEAVQKIQVNFIRNCIPQKKLMKIWHKNLSNPWQLNYLKNKKMSLIKT